MPDRDAASCLLVAPQNLPDPLQDLPAIATESHDLQVAVLAGGCFWCTEAVFQQLVGVKSVVSGYTGGSAETADYRSVCTGSTGHAEVIRIEFDPRQTSFGQLLKLFFSVAHDPTQLNRQGNDLGTQYRSAIFFVDDDQRRIADAYIRQLNSSGLFIRPIVTALEPLHTFYPAEEYHQNYAIRNPEQPYVAAAALPKVAKLMHAFPDRVRE